MIDLYVQDTSTLYSGLIAILIVEGVDMSIRKAFMVSRMKDTSLLVYNYLCGGILPTTSSMTIPELYSHRTYGGRMCRVDKGEEKEALTRTGHSRCTDCRVLEFRLVI